jgi:alkylation response protein AidB-like acyl-CoA dehydrogenase
VDLRYSESEERFRKELREWLAGALPTLPPKPPGNAWDDRRAYDTGWQRQLFDAGYAGISWPAEYGGRGATLVEQLIYLEETTRAGAPYVGVNFVGTMHAGPTIMHEATPEQKAEHLPRILRGEEVWCQGFSEPNAGSDLASLQTAARRDGEGWRVSGQKIWTSYATMAQWCFLLARTSKGEKKQQGLTIFLVPMDDPAIEVRPIATMLGPHHLNEVFFDDLWVTEENVLGTVDEGWRVVQEVLAFERVGIARYARCERLLQAAPTVLGDRWDDLPAELRGRWARMLTHCRRARLLAYRVIALQSSGRVTPGDTAAYRITVTRLDQESAEVLMEIVANGETSGEAAERFRRAVEDHWRYAQASTVSSGSIEMQRILLARALLATS